MKSISPEAHGRRYTYTKLRCRCAPCSQANTAYERNRRKRVSQKPKPPKPASVTSHEQRQACQHVENPAIFFPAPGDPGTEAKRVCARCSVRQGCLEWALDTYQRWGVWGGTSANERRALWRARTPVTVDAWLTAQQRDAS